MSPIPPVYHTVVTVNIGLKNVLRVSSFDCNNFDFLYAILVQTSIRVFNYCQTSVHIKVYSLGFITQTLNIKIKELLTLVPLFESS